MMIDYELLERTRKMTGALFTGGVSRELVCKLEKDLGVTLPASYIEFLRNFGEGGLSGTYTFGIEDEDFASAWVDTMKYRKELHLPEQYVVIARIKKEDGEHYLVCLDTAEMGGKECPIIKWDLHTGEKSSYKDTFFDYFNSVTENEYQCEMKYIEAHPKTGTGKYEAGELPRGVGYKSCWMVIRGGDEEQIQQAFSIGDSSHIPFEEGIKTISQAGTNNFVMLWKAGEDLFYLIGDAVVKFSYDDKLFRKVSKEFSEVYLFFTHRVSETHGFAKVAGGVIKRAYYYDEDRIVSKGRASALEKHMGYVLPKSFEERNQNRAKFTDMDEDVVVALAERLTGVQNPDYSYERVLLGTLGESGV